MENLKQHSIKLYPQMSVFWCQHDTVEQLGSKIFSKFNDRKLYAVNNSTIRFQDKSGVYVTPFTRNALETLANADYLEEHFYVPFSNGDVPEAESARWAELRAEAQASYREDFAKDCTNWCNRHNIHDLPDWVLGRCFEMPSLGVPVKHLYFEERFFPICNELLFDRETIDKLGHFCTNNGKVVFVYKNGKTYVARGYWIIEHLQHANFTEAGLFVPFSNGEEITDPALKARWDAIQKH